LLRCNALGPHILLRGKTVSGPAPRIDLLSREPRNGFAQYGNEIGKFALVIAGVASCDDGKTAIDIDA
jgi:hypothetical protein